MALTLKVMRVAAMTAIIATATSTAYAQQTSLVGDEQLLDAQMIEDLGGADRMNFSGKLRMLSQRIPAAACNLQAGVNVDHSAEILAATSEEFNKIVSALEHGDPNLGIIGKETRRKTLAALDGLKAAWAPVGAATGMIMAEGMTASHNEQLAVQNGPLLEAAKLLVSELVGQYSNPASVVQSDALRIDIAGRQRMLSQKISKELCYALSGLDADAARENLGKTVSTFDVSLTALREGMPAAGIKASTDPEIVAGLDLVAGEWAVLQPYLQAVMASETLDEATRGSVFEMLNTLLVDMNKVVLLYSQISKQQI
jgi:hypothetical protein